LLVTILQHLYDKFVTEARQLRHEYRDRIRLLIGLESELIYPEILDKVQELIKRHSLDYIVGSVHHVEGVPIDYDISTYQLAEQAAHAEWLRLNSDSTAKVTPTEAIFLRYFDLQFDMLQRLRPAIVGHFDLV
jgi:histidinol-phosphatase (PHP family)